MTTARRLIITSNRLPFVIHRDQDELKLQKTCGGLAAALSAVHHCGSNLWIGWPGECGALAAAERVRLDGWLRQKRVVPVDLTAADVAGYYDGVCNSVLWPVLHSLLDRLPVTLPEFQTYRAVNERFAETIVREFREGDIVWIHDYHLLLAPALVRMMLPHAHIGFFLHTPFPAADIFRVLPWRRELLDGLLGSTLVGFQTERDARNFRDSVQMIAGYHAEDEAVIAGGREVRVRAYPIGIDPVRLPCADPESALDETRSDELALTGRRLLLGIDRLDYSKGLTRRVAAFGCLLESHPELHGRVELLQVAVPSRIHVPSYAECKQEIETLVASINSRHATAEWTPIRYVSRAVSSRDLSGLYAAADVMLVTSLRDGMNLVAKEFVLARNDEDGVLILSEFAGAAEQLTDAMLINPYAVDQLASAMAEALALDREERRRRMRALRQRVAGGTVHAWMDRFTSDLLRQAMPASSARLVVDAVQQCVATGQDVSMVLQYEHVLVPRSRCAEPFRPDPELLALLRGLGTLDGIAMHIVSGFDHDTLDQWFESIPVTIWAEHGLWRRERDGHQWRQTQWLSTEWTDDVRELLEHFASRTPGALVDQSGSSLTWDFSRAERVHGRSQAQLLAALLRDAGAAMGFVVTETEHALHVAPAGLTPERTLQKIRELSASPGRLVVFDDVESATRSRHVFSPEDLVVTVGNGRTSGLTLPDGHAIRELLWGVLAALPAPADSPVPVSAHHGRSHALDGDASIPAAIR